MNRGASWLQSQLKAAEELLHAVDRTAKTVSTSQGSRNLDERAPVQGPHSVSGSKHERQASFAPSPPRGHSRQGSRSRSSSFAEPSELLATSGAGSRSSEVAPEGQAAEASVEQQPGGTPFSQLAAAPSFSEQHEQQPLPGKATSPTKVASSASPQPRIGASLAASPVASATRALPPLPRQAVTPASQGPQLAGLEPREAEADGVVSSSAEGPQELPARDATHEQSTVSASAVSAAFKQREAEQEGTASPDAVPTAGGSNATLPADAAQATSASALAPQDQANGSLVQPGSNQAASAAEDAELLADASSTNGIYGGGAAHVAQDRKADGEAVSDGGGLQRSEEELDEAKSLAGGAVSQRELRLQQVVARLKQRLEQYKQENQQLEEMLRVADAKAQGGSGEIERLEDDLARAQAASISAEAALQHAMATKEGELRGVKEQLEGAQRKCGVLEEQLQHLQEANAATIQERKVSEGQLIQSLRKEVEEIERLLEEERAAHAATRKAAAAREHELEGSLQDSASSLARMQRDIEDRSSRLAAAEERCTALEHEVDSLAHQLRAAEGKLQKQAELAAQSSPEVLQQRIAELEAALQAERGATSAAEQGRAAADEELVRLKAEVGSLKRQLADTLTHSDAGDLQRRLKEVTDLLYLKQTQLERIASEKAAQQLGMERELAQARQEAAQVKRRALTDRAIAAAEDAVVPMDTIGDAYHRLANNNRVGGAVKAGARFLDATASQVVRILKQYPMGRLVAFAYVLGIHLFIYLLLHRLQRRAFSAEHSPGGGASDPLTAMHDALHRGDGHEQLTG